MNCTKKDRQTGRVVNLGQLNFTRQDISRQEKREEKNIYCMEFNHCFERREKGRRMDGGIICLRDKVREHLVFSRQKKLEATSLLNVSPDLF